MTIATFCCLDGWRGRVTVYGVKLLSTPLQALLPISEITVLERHGTWSNVTAGEVLVRQRGSGRSLTLVVAGSVDVVRSGAASVTLTATPGAPVVLGELTLLSIKLFRTATVTAASDALVVQLAGSKWDRYVAKLPVLRRFVEEQALDREAAYAEAGREAALKSFENYQAYIEAVKSVSEDH